MITRKWPIIIGVIMIVLLILLIVGWVLLLVFNALASEDSPGVFWALLTVGSVFYVFLLVGISFYLALLMMTINLNQRQSNFIDSVTHELKSPIASMKLYLQTLSRRTVSHEEQTKFYGAMLEDLRRLDELVDHILEAGRLDSVEERAVESQKVDLAPLLQDCCESICLRYKVPPETILLELMPVTVQANRLDLELIFRNLIDNAVKYAGTSPRVEIRMMRVLSNRVLVRIADNGRGIPPKLRRTIFRRFVRLGVELTRDRPGTGLGLYIVQILVRRLRGSIQVHSGRGEMRTVFEVRLPALPKSE